MTGLMKFELAATHLGLRDIGPWLDQLFADAGWSGSPSRGAVELAIHELAANIVDHAAPLDGKIVINARSGGNDLHVEMADTGGAFDGADYVTPDEATPQVRGYGLMIVEQVAQSIDYSRADDRNIWTVTFAIEAAPAG